MIRWGGFAFQNGRHVSRALCGLLKHLPLKKFGNIGRSENPSPSDFGARQLALLRQFKHALLMTLKNLSNLISAKCHQVIATYNVMIDTCLNTFAIGTLILFL